MYLSYDDYLDYGGTLDEATFDLYVYEAEARVNYYTFDRLVNDTTVQEPIKRLVYALIDIAETKAKTMSLGADGTTNTDTVYITRQSNDGVETTYNNVSANTLYSLCKQEVTKAMTLYLSNVKNEAGQKVLFRGLYPGE